MMHLYLALVFHHRHGGGGWMLLSFHHPPKRFEKIFVRRLARGYSLLIGPFAFELATSFSKSDFRLVIAEWSRRHHENARGEDAVTPSVVPLHFCRCCCAVSFLCSQWSSHHLLSL
jgi:hypothetical protein